MKFQKIENALQALRDGKNILVMDDETRENEGDLICAAQYATTEKCKLYGSACERANLYADEQRSSSKPFTGTNGYTQYR